MVLRCLTWGLLALVMGGCAAIAPSELPTITVVADNTVVDRSCRLVVAADSGIADVDGDGVIQIVGHGITVEFASELRGPQCGEAQCGEASEYEGVGVVVIGTDITVRNLEARRFRCALRAQQCRGLVIEGARLRELRRQQLHSTATAESTSDWLRPHENDNGEWFDRYGAAICIEESRDVVVRNCEVRSSQNGLILDQVHHAEIYDNDFSFLSGWGIAMWRSGDNVICKNALDFCVRGYSHGVYNRGQDSAGLLMFEQCSRNVVAFNSMTHGGDGVFGFAGREALGELSSEGKRPPGGLQRAGNNDNRFEGNDLSYAVAHGFEMTFSFGNIVRRNRMVENAICGIWGGYSCDMMVLENVFEKNGALGYGLERGAINIEHGSRNRIEGNQFRANACSIHLWWDDDALLQTPWAEANGNGECVDNVIVANTFVEEPLVLHQRGPCHSFLADNKLLGVGEVQRLESEGVSNRVTQRRPQLPPWPLPISASEMPGAGTPVNGRPELAGRENIVMTEWGPWDHAEPLLRELNTGGGMASWELRTPSGKGQPRVLGPRSRRMRERRRVRTAVGSSRGRGWNPRVSSTGHRSRLVRGAGREFDRRSMAGDVLQLERAERSA